MIRFSLTCANSHGFEGWFRSNDDYDQQSRRGLISCPHCHSNRVGKALMSPAVATRAKGDSVDVATTAPSDARMVEMVRALKRHLKHNAEDVGDRFAEEARKMHSGEVDERGIYGQATREEALSLHEEGIAVVAIPDIGDDDITH